MLMLPTNITLRHILKDKISLYLKKFGKKLRLIELISIQKMLLCGDKKLGYRSFYCVNCGIVKKIPFSCKTKLCSRCGHIANERFAINFTKRMLPFTHRHIIFTIPNILWNIFHERVDLQKQLLKNAYKSIKEIMSFYNKTEVIPGAMAVLHTFGRDLKENCHIHIIVTEGGYTRLNMWRKFTFFPFEKRGKITITLKEVWRDNVLESLRLSLPRTRGNYRFIEGIRDRNPEGFYVYSPSENRIKTNQKAHNKAKYITRYVKHPVISDRRIIYYDGNIVKFWYDYPTTGERKIISMGVLEFINRVLNHIPEKYVHQVVYYGLYSAIYSNQVQTRYIFSPSGEIVDPEKLSWRERVILETGKDPQICERCNMELLFICIVSKTANGYKVYYKIGIEDIMAIGYPNEEMWLININ